MGYYRSTNNDVSICAYKNNDQNFRVSKIFVENVYQLLYGLPANIVSDCNQKFNSHVWRSILKSLDMLLNLSTTNHLEIDGKIKLVNQAF